MQLIEFLGTLKYLDLEIENCVLKINISLSGGGLKNLNRNPKVNSLTLCTIPILRTIIPKTIFAVRTRWEGYGY